MNPLHTLVLENLRKATRLSGETHQHFASRLRFMHYCKIREAPDFEALVILIISDKIFETLDKDLSTHIAVREGES